VEQYLRKFGVRQHGRQTQDIYGDASVLTAQVTLMIYEKYCTISFNSAGIVTRDGPTEILVSADAKSGRDMAKIFGSLPPEAAKIYAYRFVTENNFGRSP